MFNKDKRTKEDLLEQIRSLELDNEKLTAELAEANVTIARLKEGAYNAVATDISEKGKNFVAGIIKGTKHMCEATKETIKDIGERSKK